MFNNFGASKLMVSGAIIFYYVIIFAKRGLIADPNHTYLESHNLTCEFSTTLKLGPNIPIIILFGVICR